MSLGDIIRGRREELGLTQDEMALKAQISKPYLSNIETGRAKNPPSDAVLKALERAAKLPPGQLTRIAHLTRTPSDVREEHELLEAEVQHLRAVLKELLSGDARRGASGLDLDELAAGIQGKADATGFSAGLLVPVVNKLAAGYPQHFSDLDYPSSVANDYIRCPDLHDPQSFAVRVVGDSMEPKYCEGDIVVFSPAATPRSGQDCFVRFAGEGQTTFRRFYQDDPDTIRLQPLNDKYPGQTYPHEQITGLWVGVFRIERLRQ